MLVGDTQYNWHGHRNGYKRNGGHTQPPGPFLKDIAKLAAWGVAMVLIFAFISSLAATAADARPLKGRHDYARHSPHPRHGIRHAPVAAAPVGLFGGFGSSLVAEARSQLGNGAIYGRRDLWCARFMNYVLLATGHRGTGSDKASSFARYGTRVSGPQVGAIAVMTRRGGGHVGVVSGIDKSGNPVVISGNHNRRVGEAVYPRGRVYAYVLPN